MTTNKLIKYDNALVRLSDVIAFIKKHPEEFLDDYTQAVFGEALVCTLQRYPIN